MHTELTSPTSVAVASGLQDPLQQQAPLSAETVQTTRLTGKRAGMVVFSPFPSDPRPRRAAEALAKEGMKIDLICEGEEGVPKRENRGMIDVTRIPLKRRRGGALAYGYQYFSFIFISGMILAWRSLRKRYDLIYVHNMPDVLVFCALIPKLLGAKVILDQHDPMPELMMTIFRMGEESKGVRLMRVLEKISLGYANRVVTVSSTFKNIFASRSCAAEKITVVMNAPDGQLFPFRSARENERARGGKPFVIMFHGLLEERNGLHVAIAAMAKLQEDLPNAELRVFGKGTAYLNTMMERAKSLGLEDKVHYFGPRKLDDLAAEIVQCDLGIIPNPRNSFTGINTPTRIFEYLATGKPVIAPRTTGVTDYFKPEEILYFEPGDETDLAAKIRFVANKPEIAIDFAERGQQIYLSHTWSREREELIQAVGRLVL